MLEGLSRLQPLAHNAARIAIGFLFWTHGAQKLFAWFGAEEPVALMSRFGIAGVLEFFGGLLIMLGLFTRPVAFVLSGEMAVAYFWMHAMGRGSIWPWENRGELVAIYSFFWLFLSTIGAGSFSLDAWLAERKRQAEAVPVRGGSPM